MSISETQIAQIVQRYDGGRGESVPALAKSFDATTAQVRYHLKKEGVYGAEAQVPFKTDGTAPGDADDDLGIGLDDAEGASGNADGAFDATVALNAMMANPAFSKLIDQAVAARLAQMAPAAVAPVPGDGYGMLVKSIERMLDAQAVQIPGYIKPLTADQLEDRANGLIEMRVAIADAQARGDAPRYILGDKLYAGDILYDEGMEIRTYLPPAEHFRAVNKAAATIYSAMMQWIGGPTLGIEDQLAAAIAKTHEPPMVTGNGTQGVSSPVELVEIAHRHEVKPKRVAGTLTPETHGVSMPQQPGITQQPTGPIFIGAAA